MNEVSCFTVWRKKGLCFAAGRILGEPEPPVTQKNKTKHSTYETMSHSKQEQASPGIYCTVHVTQDRALRSCLRHTHTHTQTHTSRELETSALLQEGKEREGVSQSTHILTAFIRRHCTYICWYAASESAQDCVCVCVWVCAYLCEHIRLRLPLWEYQAMLTSVRRSLWAMLTSVSRSGYAKNCEHIRLC